MSGAILVEGWVRCYGVENRLWCWVTLLGGMTVAVVVQTGGEVEGLTDVVGVIGVPEAAGLAVAARMRFVHESLMQVLP